MISNSQLPTITPIIYFFLNLWHNLRCLTKCFIDWFFLVENRNDHYCSWLPSVTQKRKFSRWTVTETCWNRNKRPRGHHHHRHQQQQHHCCCCGTNAKYSLTACRWTSDVVVLTWMLSVGGSQCVRVVQQCLWPSLTSPCAVVVLVSVSYISRYRQRARCRPLTEHYVTHVGHVMKTGASSVVGRWRWNLEMSGSVMMTLTMS